MKRFEKISKWDLKKYDWFKCSFQNSDWTICEWEFCIEDDCIYVLHNTPEANWNKPYDIKWYNYSWIIYSNAYSNEAINNNNYQWIEIETKELKHNEIEVDWVVYRKVYVSDNSIEDALMLKKERILLTTLPWVSIYWKYVAVMKMNTEDFLSWKGYDYNIWRYIAEIPEPKEEVKTKVTLELTKEQIEQIKKIIS